MKIFRIIILVFIPFSGLQAQHVFNSEIDSLILRGIYQNFACQFDSASQTFLHLTERMPNHPAGYFHQAVVLQSKMLDLETDFWEDEFFDLLEKTLFWGERQVELECDPWTFYYMGSALCCKGFYQAKKGGYLPGFMSARKGTRYLKKAVERDSTLYDAYLLLGAYQYWSGRFSKYFKWLPFVHDKRDNSISMLQLTIEKSVFSHWPGTENLAWIEYDRKNYPMALALFRKGLMKFPQSRFFLWGTADTSFRLGDFTRAAFIYESLLRTLSELPINNGYNEIVCRFKLVKTYHESRQYEKALRHCQKILNKKLEPKIQKRVRDRREETAKYVSHIQQILQESN